MWAFERSSNRSRPPQSHRHNFAHRQPEITSEEPTYHYQVVKNLDTIFKTQELFCVPPSSSARLTFRSWTDQDNALAEALWCDPEVTYFFGGPMTREQTRDRLHTEYESESRLGIQYWPMFLRGTGEFAGCAGLRPWSMDANTIEVGVNLMRSAWGLRLGEEALRAVLAYGFDSLDLPRIVAGHGREHDNSRKLLERVGFEYTHDILWGPQEIEVCMWAITAEAWRDENPS
jgi:RimJ/RimL family protein N-acetyltransferase